MAAADIDIQAILNACPELDDQEREKNLAFTAKRIFDMDSFFSTTVKVKDVKGGIGGGIEKDTAVSSRYGWMIIVSRLMTRGAAINPSAAIVLKKEFVEFLLNDFHKRMDLAIFWLFEEYMAEYSESSSSSLVEKDDAMVIDTFGGGYEYWLCYMLDSMKGNGEQGSGLDAKDRIFTRFLVEVPEMTTKSLDVVREYCYDTQRYLLFTLLI